MRTLHQTVQNKADEVVYIWSFKHPSQKLNKANPLLFLFCEWKSGICYTFCWRFLATELKTCDIKLCRESIAIAPDMGLLLIKLLWRVNNFSELWYKILCSKINQTRDNAHFLTGFLFGVMRFPEIWAFFTFPNVPLSFAFFVLLFWFIYFFDEKGVCRIPFYWLGRNPLNC